MNDNIEFLENNVLAAFILDVETHRYIKELTEDFFHISRSKAIFKIIKNLYLNKQDINIITINNKLIGNNSGAGYLQELMHITDNFISSANIQDSINKLQDINIRFQIQNVLTAAFKNLKDTNNDPIEIRKDIIKEISSIQDTRNISIAENMQDAFIKTLDSIENKYKKGEDYSYYTGFFELDKLTDGLHECELTAIGARPGVGKTAIAINIATNIAKKNKKVYFCSLEMSTEQLMQRIIASFCRINTQFLRTGRMQASEMESLAAMTEQILKLNLKIDTRTRNIEELENIAITLKDKNEIDLLIIDYLTLLKSKEKYMSREIEVAEISRRLKLLALDLKIPIIILVQLNRDAENKVPTMANIRESGSIEQNCDNIIFLHNENDEKKPVEVLDVILEKQRQGTTGIIKLAFDKKYSTFKNIVK